MPCVKPPPRTWRRTGNALLRIASDSACRVDLFDKPKVNWINCVRGGRRSSLQAQGDFCGTALTAYLSTHGYRVSTAESAPMARRVLTARAIDLVVLDIMMPGEDGLT